MAGLPDFDVEDLMRNVELKNYTMESVQIKWLFEVLRDFTQLERSKFLFFSTGSKSVPSEGFAGLQGRDGP